MKWLIWQNFLWKWNATHIHNKYSVKSTFLLPTFFELVSRNIFQNLIFFLTPHCTVKITETYSHWTKISSNHLFCNFFSFSKDVTFTKFLPKKSKSKFPSFIKDIDFTEFLLKTSSINRYSLRNVVLYSHPAKVQKPMQPIFCNARI